MAITWAERLSRKQVEKFAAFMIDKGLAQDADNIEYIRQEILSRFITELDGKLKNLQDGEGISATWRLDIIRTNGKVRGGSGSQRNMPEYIKWRQLVFERDNYKCQECGNGGHVQAHHIKPWAYYPDLRFDIDNGMTLCRDCHAQKHPHIKII